MGGQPLVDRRVRHEPVGAPSDEAGCGDAGRVWKALGDVETVADGESCGRVALPVSWRR